jgi:hypothetical protein
MVTTILTWLWQKTDGWKMVIGFVLSHIPTALGNPDPLIKALEDALTFPSWANATLALGQGLLLVGAFLKTGKNLGLLSAKNDAVVKKLELPTEFKR